MTGLYSVRVIFALLAAIFFTLALASLRKPGSGTPVARKAWLRIGCIFALISAYLFLLQRHVP